MLLLENEHAFLEGPAGRLEIPLDDEIAWKFAMLFEGQCEGLGPSAAARKYDLSRQRYFQLLRAFQQGGSLALRSDKRGPKTQWRRTTELVRQVILHRFLDPGASVDVIAQKLRQCGTAISVRSVQRVLSDYGLQKKTLRGGA